MRIRLARCSRDDECINYSMRASARSRIRGGAAECRRKIRAARRERLKIAAEYPIGPEARTRARCTVDELDVGIALYYYSRTVKHSCSLSLSRQCRVSPAPPSLSRSRLGSRDLCSTPSATFYAIVRLLA